MVNYKCIRCGYETNHKTKMKSHLHRKTVCKPLLYNINLLHGLKLVGDYLEKSILKPNNINYPSERLDFINILK